MLEHLLEWVAALAAGRIEKPDQGKIKAALESLGADFSKLTEVDIRNLGKYGSAAKKAATNKIWGDKKKPINDWIRDWAAEHDIPRLVPAEDQERETTSSIEGLKGFFYNLTAYAAEALGWEQFYLRLNAAIFNATMRSKGFKGREYRMFILVPGVKTRTIIVDGQEEEMDIPFSPASLPAHFGLALYEQLVRMNLKRGDRVRTKISSTERTPTASAIVRMDRRSDEGILGDLVIGHTDAFWVQHEDGRHAPYFLKEIFPLILS